MTSKRPDELRLDRLATPIGEALIVTDEEGYLRAFDWADREAAMARLLRLHYGSLAPRPGAAPADMMRRLRHYFDGDIAGLAPIPWRTAGTPFQRRVWGGLTTIAPGTTLSYGALAAQLGCASAIRAVGRANGSNPISVVVPCHRVIGADGTLTGYGGGLPRKRWLLEHEGAAFRSTAERGERAAQATERRRPPTLSERPARAKPVARASG
jgi:methylated-DNA-[protein]-cysteine S-methyltransferase